MATTQARGGSDFQLGIQMFSLRKYSLDEALRHASELGFTQVEFYKGMLATDASKEEIKATKKKVSDLGHDRFGTRCEQVDR